MSCPSQGPGARPCQAATPQDSYATVNSELTRWSKYDPRRLGIIFLAGLAFGIFYGYHILWLSFKRWLLTKRSEKEN